MAFAKLIGVVVLPFAALAPLCAQAPQGAPAAKNPIPDIGVLMQQVLENQNQIDKLREKYACRDLRRVEELDKHGKVKKTVDSVYQISFFAGREIQRLVEENGQALSPKDQSREDGRVRKEIAKYEAEEKDGRSAEQEEKTELSIQDFLQADRFVHPRNDTVDGRPVIAFDFEPNSAFRAKTRVEKVAQALVGTIWIDVKAHEVVRLDAHFTKNFKLGWGMVASVHRGTAVAYRQTLIHNEVWLPTYVQANISLRAFLFSSNRNQIDRYSDYREFRVQSISGPMRSRNR